MVFTEAREARADQLYLIQAASGETKAYGDAWIDASRLGPEDELFTASNALMPPEWISWFGIVQAKGVSDDTSLVKTTEDRALHASQYLKTPMRKGAASSNVSVDTDSSWVQEFDLVKEGFQPVPDPRSGVEGSVIALLQNQMRQAELIDLLEEQLAKQARSQALAEKTASDVVVLLEDVTNALKAALGNSPKEATTATVWGAIGSLGEKADAMESDVRDLGDRVDETFASADFEQRVQELVLDSVEFEHRVQGLVHDSVHHEIRSKAVVSGITQVIR
jgi:hypothetical protein